MTATRAAGTPLARVRAALLVVVGLAIVGCESEEVGGPLPPAAPEVQVTIVENELVYETPAVAGRVVFRVENAGEHPHRLSLVSMSEGSAPIEEQLEEAPDDPPVLVARIAPLRPGEEGMFAAWLDPGQRYALVDMSASPDGSTNARLGIASEFRTGGG